jgi:hypothetical protein
MKKGARAKFEGSTNYIKVSTIELSNFEGKGFNSRECIVIAKDNSKFSIIM